MEDPTLNGDDTVALIGQELEHSQSETTEGSINLSDCRMLFCTILIVFTNKITPLGFVTLIEDV